MASITPELIEKAKEANSVVELLELAKANSINLTEEEAKTYFEQLSANGEVADEELDAVSGGCGDDGDNAATGNIYPVGTSIKMIDGTVCTRCKSPNGKITYQRPQTVLKRIIVCEICGAVISETVDHNRIALA